MVDLIQMTLYNLSEFNSGARALHIIGTWVLPDVGKASGFPKSRDCTYSAPASAILLFGYKCTFIRLPVKICTAFDICA